MHQKKKSKKHGIGWTLLKICAGIAGTLVVVLGIYIIYLFASYHRIEDNLELTVESPPEQLRIIRKTQKNSCRPEKNIPH